MAGMTAQARRGTSRLLVIGASQMRAAAFATWRSMGLQIVLVDGYSMGRYEDLAHEFWALDPRDGRADIERLTQLARTCDGVTTLTDDSQHTVAIIAEQLQRPGVGAAAGEAARSKALQRSLCQRAGMDIPRWRQVRGPEDIREFYADGAAAAVIKPVDSAGGAAAQRVENEAEAIAHWPIVRSLSPSRTAVIEDFIDGREVCVDAVASGGRPRFVSVADCQHMKTVGFLCTSARYDAAQRDREPATAMIQQVIGALNVGEGIVHAEFKIQGDRWVMVETGLRPGGAFVPELTVRITGVDLYQAQARLALGQAPPVAEIAGGQPEAPYAQSRYLVGEGQVRRFVPPGTILDGLPDVRVVNQQVGLGQQMRMPLSEAGRAGYAYGWGTDQQRLDAQLREAIARLGRAMGLTVRGNDPDTPELAEAGPRQAAAR